MKEVAEYVVLFLVCVLLVGTLVGIGYFSWILMERDGALSDLTPSTLWHEDKGRIP